MIVSQKARDGIDFLCIISPSLISKWKQTPLLNSNAFIQKTVRQQRFIEQSETSYFHRWSETRDIILPCMEHCQELNSYWL
jgi:hypothetical protein